MGTQASATIWGPPGTRPPPGQKPAPTDFATIYEAWFDEVARWVRAMGGPSADQDDLVQDVFLVVHRRLAYFDGENLGGWLYQITRRRVRDYRRTAWIRRLLWDDGLSPERKHDAAIASTDTIERADDRQLLDKLLMDLPEEQRVAFTLFEIEGYSGEEIASFQAVGLNTVWGRIHTARKKLGVRLSKLERSNRRH
jgi:RNA polymerase sigma-70 factor, ECF subfamily